mmetsp:Transcript_12309/g.31362  ORF Transcript_12309/g.31362 Transcript_12309/m.31362 type:complete len:198 (+) Transcript_12309:329-922(+)
MARHSGGRELGLKEIILWVALMGGLFSAVYFTTKILHNMELGKKYHVPDPDDWLKPLDPSSSKPPGGDKGSTAAADSGPSRWERIRSNGFFIAVMVLLGLVALDLVFAVLNKYTGSAIPAAFRSYVTDPAGRQFERARNSNVAGKVHNKLVTTFSPAMRRKAGGAWNAAVDKAGDVYTGLTRHREKFHDRVIGKRAP